VGRPLTLLSRRLTDSGLGDAVDILASRDSRLAQLRDENGIPPLWGRPEGFATLVKIILEQQVSLDSAAAAFSNLEDAIGPVAPTGLLSLDDAELKRIGFSRQKAGYCRGIASGLLDGALDLGGMASRSDVEARDYLMAVKGIGPWTSDVYVLFALRRADVWPSGDRALVVSMAESLPLPEVPAYEAADEMAERWRPWRSVAARMLWHSYLKKRGRSLD
jgi:DNA-3-methyladenine glycosylase II